MRTLETDYYLDLDTYRIKDVVHIYKEHKKLVEVNDKRFFGPFKTYKECYTYRQQYIKNKIVALQQEIFNLQKHLGE